MAMVVCRCNMKRVAWCGMFRATLEATGCCHWVTTCFVLPQQPPGQQQTKQRQKHAPTLLAILMAVVVRTYNTTCIAQWRRSRASLEATGHCHWASIMSNNIKRTYPCRFLSMFFILQAHSKRMAPTNTRGMTYQMKEKHLSSLRNYFVEGVNIAFNHLIDIWCIGYPM